VTPKQNTPRERNWLDSNGEFIFGKHAGSTPQELIDNGDESYLRWIINDVEDCSHEDRDIISLVLEQNSRRGRR